MFIRVLPIFACDTCVQQRTGFNPYLKDSCHTRDGYVLYGEKAGIKDSSYVDVVGGGTMPQITCNTPPRLPMLLIIY
jgi:hypothetical protein